MTRAKRDVDMVIKPLTHIKNRELGIDAVIYPTHTSFRPPFVFDFSHKVKLDYNSRIMLGWGVRV